MAERPYLVEIEYDDDLGYPRRVRINLNHISDADYGFMVEGFRVLAR